MPLEAYRGAAASGFYKVKECMLYIKWIINKFWTSFIMLSKGFIIKYHEYAKFYKVKDIFNISFRLSVKLTLGWLQETGI